MMTRTDLVRMFFAMRFCLFLCVLNLLTEACFENTLVACCQVLPIDFGVWGWRKRCFNRVSCAFGFLLVPE